MASSERHSGEVTSGNGLVLEELAPQLTGTGDLRSLTSSPVSLPPLRTPASQQTSRLSKYGVKIAPPQDDAVHYSSDTKGIAFFEKV